MRYLIPAFASLVMATSLPSYAQTPAPAAEQTTAAPPAATAKPAAPKVNKLARRFAKANTTHDGHLTLAQARTAKWSQVVKHFSQIDTDNKGFVTEQDIRTAAAAARAAKAAANTT
jgi:hypothetical protein